MHERIARLLVTTHQAGISVEAFAPHHPHSRGTSPRSLALRGTTTKARGGEEIPQAQAGCLRPCSGRRHLLRLGRVQRQTSSSIRKYCCSIDEGMQNQPRNESFASYWTTAIQTPSLLWIPPQCLARHRPRQRPPRSPIVPATPPHGSANGPGPCWPASAAATRSTSATNCILRARTAPVRRVLLKIDAGCGTDVRVEAGTDCSYGRTLRPHAEATDRRCVHSV